MLFGRRYEAWKPSRRERGVIMTTAGRQSRSDAEMTELADVQDLGSCAARREGSSPFFRSIGRKIESQRFRFCAVLRFKKCERHYDRVIRITHFCGTFWSSSSGEKRVSLMTAEPYMSYGIPRNKSHLCRTSREEGRPPPLLCCRTPPPP